MHPVLPAPAAASPERMTGLILHGRSRGPSAFIGGHVSGGWTAAHAVVPKSGLQVGVAWCSLPPFRANAAVQGVAGCKAATEMIVCANVCRSKL